MTRRLRKLGQPRAGLGGRVGGTDSLVSSRRPGKSVWRDLGPGQQRFSNCVKGAIGPVSPTGLGTAFQRRHGSNSTRSREYSRVAGQTRHPPAPLHPPDLGTRGEPGRGSAQRKQLRSVCSPSAVSQPPETARPGEGGGQRGSLQDTGVSSEDAARGNRANRLRGMK